MDIVATIITTTYGAFITAAIGWIVKNLNDSKKQREAQNKEDAANRLAQQEEMKESFIVMCKQISNMNAQLSKVQRTIDDDRAIAARYRIIRFDDERSQGIYHSDDHCDQILEDIDVYDTHCKDHPDFVNHKGQGAMRRILDADRIGKLKQGGTHNV